MVERAQLRRRTGMTQKQLARAVGVSAPQLCLWERGEVSLDDRTVARIADVIHETLSETPWFADTNELVQALSGNQFANPEAL
jgi:transcriptional regulator with XRE-family HTH domain